MSHRPAPTRWGRRAAGWALALSVPGLAGAVAMLPADAATTAPTVITYNLHDTATALPPSSQPGPSRPTPTPSTPSPDPAKPSAAASGQAAPSTSAPAQAAPSTSAPAQAAPSTSAPAQAAPSTSTPGQAGPGGEIAALLRRHDPGGAPVVMALQEAGDIAALTGTAGDATTIAAADGGDAYTYRTHTWTVDDVGYRIHWLPADADARPVNLALLLPSAQPTGGFMVVTNPYGRGSLPAFGVRLGDTWYFTLHATAGGRDMPALMQAIADATAGAPWQAFGTFNVAPQVWNDPGHPRFVLPDDATVQASDHVTHITRAGTAREVDYGITSTAPVALAVVSPWVPSAGGSHAPVVFPAATSPDEEHGHPTAVPSTSVPCIEPVPLPGPSSGPVILPGPDRPASAAPEPVPSRPDPSADTEQSPRPVCRPEPCASPDTDRAAAPPGPSCDPVPPPRPSASAAAPDGDEFVPADESSG
ncbi:hypothetical protein [Actinoplanes sp. NPDC049681]|uniref:hypothetical protein n=1 Tax=Actinoplanes sp. NPDC049681 TaxID=3363905 RepID=UPI0037A44F24